MIFISDKVFYMADIMNDYIVLYYDYKSLVGGIMRFSHPFHWLIYIKKDPHFLVGLNYKKSTCEKKEFILIF